MIVVTGATGNVGCPLMELLGDKAVGVSRPQVDLARPETLEPVLDGAEAMFLLFAGDLLGPDTDIASVLDVAKAGGVRRVVLLSSQGAGTRPAMVPHSRLAGFEEALRQSSLEWTILRPSGFFTNTFAWVRPIREHGVAAAPFADVAIPFVDPADIAGRNDQGRVGAGGCCPPGRPPDPHYAKHRKLVGSSCNVSAYVCSRKRLQCITSRPDKR